MHRSLARYSAAVSSIHAPSWADFITTMVGFRVFGTHSTSHALKASQRANRAHHQAFRARLTFTLAASGRRYCSLQVRGKNPRSGGGQRPAEMAMTGIVENASAFSCSDMRHHVWHHRAQTTPRYGSAGIHPWKELARPLDQWPDPIVANVVVDAVEFSGACHTETIGAEPARNNFRVVIEQTDPGSALAAVFVVKR